ncbi:AsmA-like C-terminal region-containing protein [Bacteroidota bacterium]
MKKVLIIFGILLILIIAIGILIPVVFKDDIKAAIDKQVASTVKADVFYDTDKVSMSLFRNFPNLTIGIGEFGVVGIGEFAGDTLMAVDRFDLTIDLMKMISGNKIQLKSITLDRPRIIILVMEDGTANYDIMVETGEEEEVVKEEEPSDFSIAIDNWEIRDGRIVYYDLSLDFAVVLNEINHKGSGDFSLDVFDMDTYTEIERMMVSFEDVQYLKDKRLVTDLRMNMNMADMKFTFMENRINLNDFSFGFDGFLEMPSEDIEMDISFQAKDNSFKSLLSLVPGIYTQDFPGIEANGMLKFEGFIKGIYSEASEVMPTFSMDVFTENASFHYPDLPESIKNIKVDMMLKSEEGDMARTEMNLRDFHLDFGNNPVDMKMHIKNMVDYDMEASIDAKMDFGNLMQMMPMEGMSLSGLLDASMNISGTYDSMSNTFPAVNGNFSLKNFNFSGDDFSQGMKIESAQAMMNPSRIDIDHFDGSVGESDMHISGYISNYISYAMEENAILEGTMDFSSNQFDLNEWMTEEDTLAVEEDSVSLEVYEVPANIDFTLNSAIGKVLYDDMELEDLKGMLIIRDGMVRMDGIRFNTLGGQFGMSGTYDTRDMEHPAFDFDINIEDLAIPEAYQSFVTIQKLAPIAAIMDGNFSTNFKLASELQPDMMPDMATLKGGGLIKIVKASVTGSKSKLVSGINGLTKMGGDDTNISLSDVLMQAEIINGRVFLEPFEVKIGDNKALVGGSNGIDGSLDYNIKMDVPDGAVQKAGSLVSSLAGQNLATNAKDVKLNFGVKGDYNDPKVTLLGAETGSTSQKAKETLKAQAQEEKEKLQKEAEVKAEEEIDKVKDEAEEVVKEQEEKLKEEVEKTKKKLKKFLKGG